MRIAKFARLPLVLAVALAGACGDDDDETTIDAVTTVFDAAPGIDARLPPDAPVSTGDGNDTFDTATASELPIDEEGLTIDPVLDKDFYSFTGTAGQWLFVYASADVEGEPDPVVTLYNSARTQIANNDDSLPWVSPDSELIARLPSDGTYYIEVRDWADWQGETELQQGGPEFTYSLLAGIVNPAYDATDSINADSEAAATVALAVDASNEGYQSAYILGAFDSATDEDVFTFTVGAPTTGTYSVVDIWVIPGGNGVDTNDLGIGSGSTVDPGELTITSSDGTVVYAKINYDADGRMEAQPALAAGDYQLHIKHPGGTAGANDFYIVKYYAFTSGDNPAEAETSAGGANDTLATAQALAMETDTDGVSKGFILAFIDPTAADVDYFSFDVQTGEVISVACGALSSGGGIDGLNASVRNASDTVLTGGSATEDIVAGISLQDLAISGAGTHYLRLGATSYTADVTAHWIRCGVYVGTPSN